ncbi:Rad2 nuclease [Gonapodya sp. JEL0774]|nr:Rad2 nuclease [Gonapodya sp. JEL0774]
MGIQGLLPLLEQAKRRIPLSDLDSLTIAVDAYVWLHKGVISCSTDLALGKETKAYVKYFMDKTALLCRNGIKPYFVFDGGNLPSKIGTEKERARRRRQLHAEGMTHFAAKRMQKAHECFIGAVDVTPHMAHDVIKELRRHQIDYVVAPFEADAQLCYLEREGIVAGVLTEDSDLIVFGCKRVLCKLDKDGRVDEYVSSRLSQVQQGEFVLGGRFTHDKFRWMCILAGCDYLKGIPGMGLKKAYRAVKNAIRSSSYQYRFPQRYADEFRRAERTFLYQRVFDPRSGQLVTLNELPESIRAEEMPYIGENLPPTVAKAIAEGRVCPIAKRIFSGESADLGDYVPPSLDDEEDANNGAEDKENEPPELQCNSGSSSAPPQKRKSWPGAECGEPGTAKRRRTTEALRIVNPDKAAEVVDPSITSKFFGPSGGAPKAVSESRSQHGSTAGASSGLCPDNGQRALGLSKLGSMSAAVARSASFFDLPPSYCNVSTETRNHMALQMDTASISNADLDGELENDCEEIASPPLPASAPAALPSISHFTSQETDEQSDPCSGHSLSSLSTPPPTLTLEAGTPKGLDAFRFSGARTRLSDAKPSGSPRRLGTGPRLAPARETKRDDMQNACTQNSPASQCSSRAVLVGGAGLERAKQEVALGMQRKFGGSAMSNKFNLDKFRSTIVPYAFVIPKPKLQA